MSKRFDSSRWVEALGQPGWQHPFGQGADTVTPVCRRITCGTCDRPSFAGCGAHIEQVLGDVAVADRCDCSPADKSVKRTGWLARLLNR